MNELKRQAYLQAMDIQTYFPRMNLKGAKSSPAYDIAVENSANPLLQEATTRSNTSKAVKWSRSLADSNRTASVSPIRPNEAATAAKVDSTPAQSVAISGARADPTDSVATTQAIAAADLHTELRFDLLYFRINEKLAVIDEVPHQGSDQSKKQSLVLMKAILKALGQDDEATNLQSEVFSWPLATGYSMKNAPAIEAGKALSGFLQMRHETDGFSNLLVFAGQIENLLLTQDHLEPHRDFESDKGYFVTVTRSLHSILAVPTLKREVWQQLQALRKRIAILN